MLKIILAINMILYSYFRNMQSQIDLRTIVFLIAVLLQDSLLAIVNTEDTTTKKQTTSLHGGNYCFFFTSKEVTSN